MKTRKVVVGDRSEQVEVLLVPLVRELWRAGISTLETVAEKVPGVAWICFSDETHFRKLLEIVGDSSQASNLNSLYRHIYPPLNHDGPAWSYQFSVSDVGKKKCSWRFIVAIAFPHVDIKPMLERLKAYNKGKS